MSDVEFSRDTLVSYFLPKSTEMCVVDLTTNRQSVHTMKKDQNAE